MEKEKVHRITITWSDGKKEAIMLNFVCGVEALAERLKSEIFAVTLSHGKEVFWNLRYARKVEIKEV